MLLIVSHSLLYILREAEGPATHIIGHLNLLQFGTQIDIRVTNITFFQLHEFINKIEHRPGIMVDNQDIINIQQDVKVVLYSIIPHFTALSQISGLVRHGV